jgi:hypothetical protein
MFALLEGGIAREDTMWYDKGERKPFEITEVSNASSYYMPG